VSSASAEVGATHTGGWSCLRPLAWFAGGQGRPVAVLATILLVGFLVLLGERYWEPVRNFVFDTYQRAFPRRVDRFPVVIVDIDETSVATLGQWPWPRTRLARLLEATHQLGVLAVGLDMIMPEVDQLSPSVFIAERPDISPGLQRELAVLPANDTILAEVLRRTPSVVGRAGTPESKPRSVRVDHQTPVRIHGETPLMSVPNYAGHLTNIPQIEGAASGRGYLNTEPDKDGVVRLVPLLVAVHGEFAPTLGLELLRVAVGEPLYSVHADRHGVRGVQLGDTFIPTDPDGRRRLHFSKTYVGRRISALDILHGRAPANALQNQVAIIGVTALGLAEVVTTPMAAHMDGVEVQAQMLENLLSGTRLVRPSLTLWWEVLAFVVSAMVLLTLLPRLQPTFGVTLFLGSAAHMCTSSVVAFTRWQTLFDPYVCYCRQCDCTGRAAHGRLCRQ
jgi:adenylate cyclase